MVIPVGSSLVEPGLTPTTRVVLNWNTFTDAADEAGLSRRYGGIHFEIDDMEGRRLGRLFAKEVWKKSLSYINRASELSASPCCSESSER